MSACVRLLVSSESPECSSACVCMHQTHTPEPHISATQSVPAGFNNSSYYRLQHAVSSRAWPSLTRHFHPGDPRLFQDSKVGHSRVVYVCSEAERARFQSCWLPASSCSGEGAGEGSGDLAVSVRVLPCISSAEAFAALEPGILALEPDSRFLVPGGRFNEMYGWDSYFMACGVLGSETESTRELALDQLRNLSYQINAFGKVFNATRSYFMNRSNPPFLSSLVRRVQETSWSSPAVQTKATAAVAKGVEAATRELLFYWLSPEKTCAQTGLAFWGSKREASLCLAVESGHYDEVFARLAPSRGLTVQELVRRVSRGDWPRDDAEVWKLVEHDLAVRESGHDTTERLVDAAADLVTADLNSLIVKTAKDLYFLTSDELFKDIADKMEHAMLQYLYDEELGYFCDWDVVLKTRKRFLSPAGVVYPLWAEIGNTHVRKRLRDSLVIFLEGRGGVVGSECLNWRNRGLASDATHAGGGGGGGGRQWDWPFGWAPHQILAWEGLAKSGFAEDAARLSFRWLATLTKVFDHHGCVPEKLDVVTKDDPMQAGQTVEYGTQCAGKDEFFGWTAASAVLAREFLGERELQTLHEVNRDSCVEEQLLFLNSKTANNNEATWSTVASL